jgi:phage shock protein PspC (stress-responsive transcriptional regulator)/FtsH-binding integral membrane protein
MTTTASPHAGPSVPPPPAHKLRRSRSNRVAAGVAGGLGEYFGFDPVLFRVLFATAAFFGGAGIIAYVLTWAAIPEEGTERAPVDGWIDWMRRRHVPSWIVAVVAGVLLWLIAFSWWAPHFFLPLLAVVVLLLIAFGRQASQSPQPPAQPPTQPPAELVGTPVNLTKTQPIAPTTEPAWRAETAAWIRESGGRRRRAAPVRITVLVVLLLTLAGLATADAVRGIVLPVYFWVTLGIVGTGLLVGMALRRTPWGLSVLLIPAVAGIIAFGGTGASLHDGVGQRHWTPVAAPASSYRLAFGQGVLDLRDLQPQPGPRTISVTMAAGQVRVIAPQSMRVTVAAHIRFGVLTAEPPIPPIASVGSGGNVVESGFQVNRTLVPPASATGQPVRVVVHLADGQVDVRR